METDNIEDRRSTWFGTAWLVGQAGFALPPNEEGRFAWPTVLSPRLEIMIRDAEKLYNLEDGHIIRHRVDFKCTPEGQSLRLVAEQALEQIADLLSFSSLCPVRLYLEPFSVSPPPAAGATYAAVSFGDPGTPIRLNPPLLAPCDVMSTVQQPVMSESGTRNRILRSLRWQRRALLALEPVVAFAHYAFALEAIAACIPTEKGDDQSARLRSFATQVAGLSEVVWKRVGRLRHALFHGGIEETSDTVQDAAWCAHVAGYVLVVALRHVLALDASATPQVPELSLGQLRDVSMSSDGLIRPQPPERLW